jgi:ribosomal protein L37AE/L43A
MLKQILFSVSKSNSEIQKSISSVTKPIEEKSICEKCGSENFYLPTKSIEWVCRNCRPPKSERHVAQSKQGHTSESTNLDGSNDLGWVSVDPAQSWGPYVLKFEKPICKCGSEYAEEAGTISKIEKFCVCCREQIFLVDF